MAKKIDVNKIDQYYCLQCNKIHKKYRKSDGKKIKIYQDHASYAKKLTSAEIWRLQFMSTWQRQVEQQKRDGKAIGTPTKTNRKKSRYQ